MIELLTYLGLSLLINVTMFVPAFIFKTDKLTDLSYGLTFIILSCLVFLLNPFSWAGVILLAMVVVWGVRLGAYLFIRINKMKKDERFDGIREKFFKFLSFWVLQGVSVWVILIPTLLFFTRASFSWAMVPGFAIWCLGILMEGVADLQKFRFYAAPERKKEWIDTGLWRYSRHPNYFGEILCWVGVYVFTFSYGSSAIIGLASPLYIIFLLLFVSGIPKLEQAADKRFGGQEDYEEYKKKTSVLVPLPVGEKRRNWIYLYLAGLAFILAVDLVWLNIVARNFYASQFGPLMRQGAIPIWSALMAWLLIVLGTLAFVVPRASRPVTALIWGALFGFVLYGLYDFTNYATLAGWPLTLTFADLAWGTFLCGLTAAFMVIVRRRFFPTE